MLTWTTSLIYYLDFMGEQHHKNGQKEKEIPTHTSTAKGNLEIEHGNHVYSGSYIKYLIPSTEL